MKSIISFYALFFSFWACAQLSPIDIAQAAFMSSPYVTHPYIRLISEKYPNEQTYPPLLQAIGRASRSPHTTAIGFALLKIWKNGKHVGTGRGSFKKNVIETTVKTGLSIISTELIDLGLSKIGYGQDSVFVRPTALFLGSMGTQIAGQIALSKIMPSPLARNQNTGCAA